MAEFILTDLKLQAIQDYLSAIPGHVEDENEHLQNLLTAIPDLPNSWLLSLISDRPVIWQMKSAKQVCHASI